MVESVVEFSEQRAQPAAPATVFVASWEGDELEKWREDKLARNIMDDFYLQMRACGSGPEIAYFHVVGIVGTARRVFDLFRGALESIGRQTKEPPADESED